MPKPEFKIRTVLLQDVNLNSVITLCGMVVYRMDFDIKDHRLHNLTPFSIVRKLLCLYKILSTITSFYLVYFWSPVDRDNNLSVLIYSGRYIKHSLVFLSLVSSLRSWRSMP